MAKTTFTAEQLEEVLEKVKNIDQDFPNLPINFLKPYQEFWDKEVFPLQLKRVGDDKDVNISVKEFIGGVDAGAMSIILQVGFGNDARYFQKNGFYDSWDNGNDDYQWDGGFNEVEAKEVKVTQWTMKS